MNLPSNQNLTCSLDRQDVLHLSRLRVYQFHCLVTCDLALNKGIAEVCQVYFLRVAMAKTSHYLHRRYDKPQEGMLGLSGTMQME